MRILYICGDLGIPAFGRKGASTHIREMIGAMRSLGHEVCLAAPDLSGDRRAGEDMETVKLPSPRSRKLGFDGRYLLANMLARRPLRKAVERFRPDAIYERSALYFTAGQWLSRRFRIPRLLEVNALLAEEQKTRLHFPAFAGRVENNLILNATGVAAISSYMVRHLVSRGRPAETTRAFPMAVNPALFKPVPDRMAARRALQWPEDIVVLGYIGSMNPYHRPIWFMDLAEKFFRREESRVRFLVVGGDPNKVERFRGRLLRWVDEGRVHFAGTVPQEGLAQWMAAMDAVLVPGSSPQATPTKIFEAAAVGCPLILPATEPIRDLCGADAPYLFKPGDFRAFEEKVRQFLANPEPFQASARGFRKKVLREYTWEHHARGITQWLAELQTK